MKHGQKEHPRAGEIFDGTVARFSGVFVCCLKATHPRSVAFYTEHPITGIFRSAAVTGAPEVPRDGQPSRDSCKLVFPTHSSNFIFMGLRKMAGIGGGGYEGGGVAGGRGATPAVSWVQVAGVKQRSTATTGQGTVDTGDREPAATEDDLSAESDFRSYSMSKAAISASPLPSLLSSGRTAAHASTCEGDSGDETECRE